MLLLGINLLFDGLTNSTQDYIFQTFRGYTGPQMMCANNLLSTLLTAGYLVLSPWLVKTGAGEWLGMDVAGAEGELSGALAFLARYPGVWGDVLGFAACGAVGQVFICELTQAELKEGGLDGMLTEDSLYPRDVLVCAAGHGHGDEEDVHHDLVRGRVWASAHADAVAGRRASIWGNWGRGCYREAGEDG